MLQSSSFLISATYLGFRPYLPIKQYLFQQFYILDYCSGFHIKHELSIVILMNYFLITASFKKSLSKYKNILNWKHFKNTFQNLGIPYITSNRDISFQRIQAQKQIIIIVGYWIYIIGLALNLIWCLSGWIIYFSDKA